MFSISQPCSRCGGSGTIIEHPCPTCSGSGIVRSVKKLRVNVPAGVKEGSRVRIAGKGEPGHGGGPPGDLYLVTHVTPSPVFKRKGENLEVEVPLTIAEAVGGADVKVPTLDGTKTLRVKPGTQHGTLQRLRGEGPPKLGSPGKRGDIHYRFTINVPKDLSDEQRQMLEDLSGGGDGARACSSRPAGAPRHEPGPRTTRQAPATHAVTRVEVETDRGVFMISVAAQLAEMHPQTLRMYEARGLIEPQRSPKGTRLYSQQDVERLRRIQSMTAELGLNLAGVERVLELEHRSKR